MGRSGESGDLEQLCTLSPETETQLWCTLVGARLRREVVSFLCVSITTVQILFQKRQPMHLGVHHLPQTHQAKGQAKGYTFATNLGPNVWNFSLFLSLSSN